MIGALAAYQFDWDLFWRSIFAPDSLILFGVWLTLSISVVAQFLGTILGTIAALARDSRLLPVRVLSRLYVWFFRGTPLLVQLTIVYFGLSVSGIYRWPEINILGFAIPAEVQAGAITLAANEGAYMAEIVRAGILAIDRGQMEAARSLGMTYGLAMRRIVLPQAARIIIPPLGNEFNSMLKNTSLLVILGGVSELYFVFQQKNGALYEPFELFLAAAVWYLLLTTIWGGVQALVERRLGRSTAIDTGPGLRDRLLGLRPAGR
jgi:polar amino acid transport system permease protein